MSTTTYPDDINSLLVFRLSSMGDILLSLAFLESLPPDFRVYWVVSSDFEFVLAGHPKITKLISFNKKSGLMGWIRLIKQLHSLPVSARVDLHRTLRTRIAFLLFWFLDDVPSFSVSKQRIRTALYLIFKNATPRRLRPTPYWIRFTWVAERVANFFKRPFKSTRPDYRFAVQNTAWDSDPLKTVADRLICIMPSSKWRSKEWAPQNYIRVIEQWVGLGNHCAILGRSSDAASSEVCAHFRGHPQVHARLDESSFANTATLLAMSKAYVGGDTGLAHLAEAVGTRALMIFGPTRPDLGFGPHLKTSQSIHTDVWCSPCSKDGRSCFRFDQPYVCLKQVLPEQVLTSLEQSAQRSKDAT